MHLNKQKENNNKPNLDIYPRLFYYQTLNTKKGFKNII